MVSPPKPITGRSKGMPMRFEGRPETSLSSPRLQLERAVELHLNRVLRSYDFPGIGPSQPVVRLLVLPTILMDCLNIPYS